VPRAACCSLLAAREGTLVLHGQPTTYSRLPVAHILGFFQRGIATADSVTVRSVVFRGLRRALLAPEFVQQIAGFPVEPRLGLDLIP